MVRKNSGDDTLTRLEKVEHDLVVLAYRLKKLEESILGTDARKEVMTVHIMKTHYQSDETERLIQIRRGIRELKQRVLNLEEKVN